MDSFVRNGQEDTQKNFKTIAYLCEDCGHLHIYQGCICGDRLECEFCRKKRVRRLRRIYLPAIQKFRFPALLTLTYKRNGVNGDGEALRKCLAEFMRAWQKLLRKAAWRKRIRHFFGGIEIAAKNVHIHLLVDCRWWSQQEIAELWRSCSGGSYIVDIRRVRGGRQGVANAFRYLLSYMFKNWAAEPDGVSAIREATRGRRLVVSSRKLLSLLDSVVETSRQVRCRVCGGRMIFLRTFILYGPKEDRADIILATEDGSFW